MSFGDNNRTAIFAILIFQNQRCHNSRRVFTAGGYARIDMKRQPRRPIPSGSDAAKNIVRGCSVSSRIKRVIECINQYYFQLRLIENHLNKRDVVILKIGIITVVVFSSRASFLDNISKFVTKAMQCRFINRAFDTSISSLIEVCFKLISVKPNRWPIQSDAFFLERERRQETSHSRLYYCACRY